MSRDLIRAFSQKLARTERLQGGELRDYQAPLLSKLLAHARDNAEFYEQRLGFDVGSRDAIERMWRAIPILTRAEVVTNRERMSSRRTPANAGQVIERETSGSIAMPLRFKTNAAASIANHALTERMYRWWRVDGRKSFAQIAYDRSKTAPGPGGKTTLGWHSARPKGTRYFLSHAFDIDTQLDWLLTRQADYLGSYSSILKGLAAATRSRGVELKFDLIFSFATVLDDETRAMCWSIFGAGIADTYGAEEVGHIAAQCPDCGEYHISGESMLVELLREDGTVAEPGEVGRVIVTPFYNYAMPLIRYELGDLAEVGTAHPSCGRGLPTLRRILGRYRNLFRFRDGKRVWPVFTNFQVHEFVPLKQMQVVQIDLDHVEIRYVPDGSDRPIDLLGLTHSVRTTLDQPVEVTLRPVERIERSPSGKYEDCVSLVPAK